MTEIYPTDQINGCYNVSAFLYMYIDLSAISVWLCKYHVCMLYIYLVPI